MYDDNGWEGVIAVGNNDMGRALNTMKLIYFTSYSAYFLSHRQKKVS